MYKAFQKKLQRELTFSKLGLAAQYELPYTVDFEEKQRQSVCLGPHIIHPR